MGISVATYSNFYQRLFIAMTLAAFFFLSLVQTAQAQAEEDNKVETSIVLTQDAIVPGEPFTLLVEQAIIPEWHTYWINPGDSGTPPKFDISLPDGFEQISEMTYPSPHRIPYGPLINYGHEGTNYYMARFMAPDDLEPGKNVIINLSAEWLVCDDICIPEFTEVSAITPVAENASLINKDKLNDAIKGTPADKNWPAEAIHFYDGNDETFTLTLNDVPEDFSLNGKEIAFFPLDWGLIMNDSEQVASYNDNTRSITLEIKRDSRDLSEISNIKGVIKIDGDYSYISLEPESVLGDAALLSNNGEQGQTTLLFALILAFLGGLALNLMPCVFPVLSMKALSLVKLQEKAKGEAVKHGLSYTFGVLLSFAVIAGILILLQQTGAQIGWGFQLQNPIITGFFAYLLFIIGLNLSGFFEINTGFSGVGENLTRGNDTKASFFTGILATLVATPCTAPFMATALGYALVQPPLIAMAVFLMLGFGLAFPYLLLTIVPQFQRALPKPGTWMETFRQFLSFPMFISALWLAWVFAQQTSVMAFASLGLGLIALAFGIWLIKHFPKKGGILQVIVIFLILGSFLWAAFVPLSKTIIIHDVANKQAQKNEQSQAAEYTAFTTDALNAALATDKPVFVNMTADWCITCKVNERLALSSNKFKDALKEYDITYLKGDWTNQDAEITKFLKSYGRNGVPIYVFYQAPDETGDRPEPKVLPQILTEGIVLNAFNEK